MNTRQLHALTLRGTDVESALRRLSGNDDIYNMCLKEFLDDPTISELNESISAHSWNEAFTAAHALKGVAGNMGFVPLMHAVGQLVVLIRSGRTGQIDESLEQVNSCYRDIVDAINQFFSLADTGAKGEQI